MEKYEEYKQQLQSLLERYSLVQMSILDIAKRRQNDPTNPVYIKQLRETDELLMDLVEEITVLANRINNKI